MKKIAILVIFTSLALSGMTQQSFTFTFSGVNNTSWLHPDSIKIMNRTQNCDTVLHWPDSSLNMTYVGIPEIISSSNVLNVSQNHPNPVNTQTSISVSVAKQEKLSISLSDINGRNVIAQSYSLKKGIHKFLFKPGSSRLYIFTAQSTSGQSSIKILNSNANNQKAELAYSDFAPSERPLKNSDAIRGFDFTPGDEIIFCAYYDALESAILDFPDSDKEYIFQFATNIPCPGMPTVNYGGQVYNTIQIFSQCWFKENLNIGTLISSTSEMEDNGEMEKYCYDSDPLNCDEYGGMYQWDEMMQYVNQESTQGICPDGWHIPSNQEWKILEGVADSLYGVGDSIWDETFYRGFDAGKNLKSASGWNNDINGMDLFDFQGKPGGIRMIDGAFTGLLFRGYWGSSNESSEDESWRHYLAFNFDKSGHSTYIKRSGRSVRCLKD